MRAFTSTDRIRLLSLRLRSLKQGLQFLADGVFSEEPPHPAAPGQDNPPRGQAMVAGAGPRAGPLERYPIGRLTCCANPWTLTRGGGRVYADA